MAVLSPANASQALLDTLRAAKGSFFLARVLLRAKVSMAEIESGANDTSTFDKLKAAAKDLGCDPDALA